MFARGIETQNEQNIVIIGLGPTGLALAIEACKNNRLQRKVIAITDRPEYTREAIFRLDVDIMPYLASLVGQDVIDDYFRRELIGPKESLNGWDFHIIQMKTLEELLYNTLVQFKNVEVICLPKRSADTIEEIDAKNHTLTIVQGEDSALTRRTISFKYLIAADGPSHNIANRVAAGQIVYDETQEEQIYTKHARVTYKLPEGLCAKDFRAFLLPVNTPLSDISSLKELGWGLHSSPEIRVFVVDGYLFAAAECPEALYNEPNNETIDRWVRAVLSLICQRSANELIRVDTAVFEVSLREANRTVVPLTTDPHTAHEDAVYFFQVGDALRTTHYQTGSGAVVGLRQAKAFGEFMQSPQSAGDLVAYHVSISDIRASNRMRVDMFVGNRKKREATAKAQNPDASLLARSLTNAVRDPAILRPDGAGIEALPAALPSLA